MNPILNHFVSCLRKKWITRSLTLEDVKSECAVILAKKDNWIDGYITCIDEEQGFSGWVIHQEDNREFCIAITSWLPHRGAPPHDHGSWSFICGLHGIETNKFWRKIKENHPLLLEKEILCKPGEIYYMDEHQIHSVQNETKGISVSLQIYGMHPNFTNRSQFDLLTSRQALFICREEL